MRRPFTRNIKRCDESLQRLIFIEQQMHEFDIEITKCEDINEVIENLKKIMVERQRAGHTYFEEVELFI